MSQTIEVRGVYRNNKSVLVGTHNPKNNRFFNDEEKEHLTNMLNTCIKPKIDKFKTIEVVMYEEGKKFYNAKYEVIDFKNNSSKDLTIELLRLYNFYKDK